MLISRRDSRQVSKGEHFIAVADQPDVRARHILDARQRGAVSVSAEDNHADIFCGHARYAWARLQAAMSGADALAFPIIGVTGTDGKTTCASLIQHGMGKGAARIGTLGFDDGIKQSPSNLTTPAAEDIHSFLLSLPQSCPGVAMEISSHAADQERLAGLKLAGLIFTGLGNDHLDYHKTRERYLQAKLKAVRLLPAGALCVVNADDELAHLIKHAVICVGARCVSIGCVQGDIRLFQEGPHQWRLKSTYADYPLHVPMLGYHNAWNATAAAVILETVGIPLSSALASLTDAPVVPGRLELCSQRPLCYVDYAHTPEALAITQRALREYYPDKKLITVFGCGGDRDHGKRAAMGTIAAAANVAIITNDNPRSEDPHSIAQMILGEHKLAASSSELHKHQQFLIELNREKAIRLAWELAADDSIILVAGKGHETQQIIGDTVSDWDDRAFIRSLGANHS